MDTIDKLLFRQFDKTLYRCIIMICQIVILPLIIYTQCNNASISQTFQLQCLVNSSKFRIIKNTHYNGVIEVHNYVATVASYVRTV